MLSDSRSPPQQQAHAAGEAVRLGVEAVRLGVEAVRLGVEVSHPRTGKTPAASSRRAHSPAGAWRVAQRRQALAGAGRHREDPLSPCQALCDEITV